MTVNNAHAGEVTDIEYSFVNNMHVFFTSGKDFKVKAWTVSADQTTLTPAAEM